MAGLFSLPTPDAVRANATQQASQRAGLFSQAPRGRAGVAAASQAGGLFGEALGRSAGGRAPGETESIAQQQVQQLVAQQVQEQGLNLSDPNDYVKMTEIAANAFNKLGMTDMATKAGEQGLAVRSKFQTEQAETFEPILNEQGNVIAQRNTKTNKVVSDPRAPKDPDTEINNYLGDQNKLAESISDEIGKDIVEARKGAKTAAESLKQSNQAIQLLDEGVVTGTGANFIIGAGKLIRRMGFNAFEDDVRNTEAFAANMGNATLAILGSGALGAGTGISDNDRKFAKQIAGGEITLDENSIRRIIKLNQKVSQNAIQNFNSDIDKIPEESLPFDLRIETPAVISPEVFERDGFKIRRKN